MNSVSATSWQVVWGSIAVFVLVIWAALQRLRDSESILRVRVAGWSIVVTSAVVLSVHAGGWLPTDIPRWFYLLAVLPFTGFPILAIGWSKLRFAGRVLATLALPLGLIAALMIANQHYGYWPTLGSFFGIDHSDPMIPPAIAISSTKDPDVVKDAQAIVGVSGVKATDQGRLVDISIPGRVSHFAARHSRVWLPPGWFSDPIRPRPVIEFIGGSPSWPSDWTRASSLDVIADQYAHSHGGEAPILVMVDANGYAFGDTECVDGPRGNADTYLSVDVPNFVRDHFDGASQASALGVIGYSEGGTCAVVLALRHPDRFSAFADLAGDLGPNLGNHKATVRALFHGSESRWAANDPVTLMTRNHYAGTRGWFAAGVHDGHALRYSRRLAEVARHADIDVSAHRYPGAHDFRFVKHALRDAVPWMSEQINVSVR